MNKQCLLSARRIVHRPLLLLTLATIGFIPSSPTRGALQGGDWVGSVRCEIQVTADGYSHQETQTWTLTGAAPKKEGAFLVYPATWSVTGQGWHDRTRYANRRVAKWTASVPGPNAPVRAPVAFLVTPGGQLFVQLWHAQLTTQGGYTGTEQYINDGVAQPEGRLVATLYEWQFQKIEADPTDTQITGSNTMEVKAGIGPLQPGDAKVTIKCTWALGQGSAPLLPPPSGSGTNPPGGTTTPPSTGTPAGSNPQNPPGSTTTPGNNPPGSSNTPPGNNSPPGGATSPSFNPDSREPNDTSAQAGLMVDRWWGNTGLPPKTDDLQLTFHAASDTSDWIKALVDDKTDAASSALQFSASVSGGPADGIYQVEISEQTSAALVSRATASAGHSPSTAFRWPNNPGSDDAKTLLVEVRHGGGAPSDVPYHLKLVWGGDEPAGTTPVGSTPGGTTPPGGSPQDAPKLLNVSPNSAEQGLYATVVTLTGEGTHWQQGTTSVDFGAGITTPFGANVRTPTTLDVTLYGAGYGITTGPRTVTVTTGAEVVALANGFAITARDKPSITQISPNHAQAGAQNVQVTLTGQGTHFAQGTSRVIVLRPEITVASLTVNSPTSATAVINVDPTAPAGAWDVMIQGAGNFEVDDITLPGGFTVESSTGSTTTPSIHVTAPNGGETWVAGERDIRDITWTQNYPAGQVFDIELSVDGGTTWSSHWSTTSPNRANIQLFSHQDLTPTNAALVRVSPAGNPAAGDLSDAPFTIAAPSSFDTPEATQRSMWHYANMTSGAPTTAILEVVPTSAFTDQWWQLVAADDASSTNSQLQFRASISGGPADRTYDLEISEQTSTGRVNRSLSGTSHAPKAGLTWPNAAGSDDSRTFFVRVHHSSGAPSNEKYRLMLAWGGPTPSALESVTVVPFTPPIQTITLAQLHVTSPNGGESWAIGQQHYVMWTHNLGGQQLFDIDFSPDRGVTWTSLYRGNKPLDLSFAGPGVVGWYVVMPQTLTSAGLIRVTPSGGTKSDVSDDPFSLVQPIVLVTKPTGGDAWTIGTRSPEIKWTHNLAPQMTFFVQLSRDGGATWTSIGSSSGPATPFVWPMVSGPATTRARVRVYSVIGGFGGPGGPPSITGESPNFTISAP